MDAAAIVAARPTVIDYGVDALTIDPSNGVFNSLTTQDGRRLEFTAPGNSSMLNNNFSSNFKCNSSKKPENGGGEVLPDTSQKTACNQDGENERA